jgi:hypothetical protein
MAAVVEAIEHAFPDPAPPVHATGWYRLLSYGIKIKMVS